MNSLHLHSHHSHHVAEARHHESVITPPNTLILAGIQGSGKGTQGKMLQKDFEYAGFDMGAQLRKIAAQETELGQLVREAQKTGALVSQETVMRIVQEFTLQRDSVSRVMFDGIPRTLKQKHALDQTLTEVGRGDAKLLHIAVSDITARKNIAYRAKVEGRADDAKPEVVEKRIRTFYEETVPVIDEFRRQGRLIHVDGDTGLDPTRAHPDEVHESIQAVYARVQQVLSGSLQDESIAIPA